MATDIEIAQRAELKPIQTIAETAGIPGEALSPYGRYMGKVDPALIPGGAANGRLILVTAMNPTPAGEGKTTVSIALADGMRKNGKKAMLALREPSLGPVFGMKGGATGGGYAQVLPMENINLHFTGDLHAITAANNLLAAMVDNHIQQGNPLDIDPRKVTVRRCLDVNDRQLRSIVSGLGGTGNGMPREDGFDITAASEVMATFCLASSLSDLKARLGRIVVARKRDGGVVTAADLKANGAMAVLLRDAFMPNLVQTMEGTPCLMHGGPFANIAHGCNSVMATSTALKLADYVVTEAGFGADLGAEKFLDIKCRQTGLWPDAVVVVATVRALKYHGGVARENLGTEDLEALERGLDNLRVHLAHFRDVWKTPVVVAVNRFVTDTEAEIEAVRKASEACGAAAELCDGWARGGDGARELAARVAALADRRSAKASYTYPDDMSMVEKVEAVARRIYGAGEITWNAAAKKTLAQIEAENGSLPVCIAKTQYSLSDDPKKLGAPAGYTLNIRSARLSAGAGFAVAFAGDIIAMPGLPKRPAAEGIDVSEDGVISGLF